MKIAGLPAVVTGGASGLGGAVAIMLAAVVRLDGAIRMAAK